jgi:uncharacterized lipoprotein
VPQVRTLVALVLLAAATLAGCGGGENDNDKTADKQLRASGAPTPVCTSQVTDPATVPAAFPADFPLPDGAVVYGSERRSGGRTIVYAVVDSDVKAVLKQLQDAMKGAGFTLTEGEVEDRDAESDWTGNGYTGRWAIREVAGCTEQTSVTVLAAKA